jgi:hypothetical protein
MLEGAMKTVTLTAIALAVSATYLPPTEAQAPKELEPSLRIFTLVSTPMPDFHKAAFYEVFPDSGGNLIKGIGNSGWVREWRLKMEPVGPRFVAIDRQLRLDVDVYADTVREEGAKVLNATANLGKLLTELDRGTSGKVQDLLAVYNDEVKATRVARAEFEAATKFAEEAKYLLAGSDAAVKECNLFLERSALEAQKAALLDRMQRGRTFLNTVEKAIHAMSGGPQAAAAYVTAEATTRTIEAAKTIILDAFFANTRETLYKVGAKIEAIDKSLQNLACKQQGYALQAARSRLEAQMIKVLVAFGTILDHRAKAWRAVDRLGTLQDPRSGQKLPFFANLKAYNAQVNLMGRKIVDSVDEYLDLLATEPLSRGELILKSVEKDIETIADAKEKRDPSGKWTSAANHTKAYMGLYTKWYEGEVRRGRTVLADLREGRHLDFVDKMMARATKELGGTVSNDDIIR